MKRFDRLSASLLPLLIVLLAGLTPGHAAAQPPVADTTPALERPYFASLSCDPPRDLIRYGEPWRSVVVYGKYRDPAGLTVDGITIELDSDTIDVDTTTSTNESGGFYTLVQFPAYQWGTIWIRGFAPDGRVTQPGECFIPERRS